MGILEYVGSIGGVGAVFALIIFTIYRQTVKEMREDRRYIEDRMALLVQENFQIREKYIETTNKHTTVLTELIIYLRTKNGSK